MNLKDRVALVTGASRGIGAVTAELLARRGAQVALSARTQPDLEQMAGRIMDAGGQAFVVPCDVLDPTEIEAMIDTVVKRCGRLDILVNNAGLGTPTMPVETIPPADWDRTVALNLRAAFLCIRAAAPVMNDRGRTSYYYLPFRVDVIEIPHAQKNKDRWPRRTASCDRAGNCPEQDFFVRR